MLPVPGLLSRHSPLPSRRHALAASYRAPELLPVARRRDAQDALQLSSCCSVDVGPHVQAGGSLGDVTPARQQLTHHLNLSLRELCTRWRRQLGVGQSGLGWGSRGVSRGVGNWTVYTAGRASQVPLKVVRSASRGWKWAPRNLAGRLPRRLAISGRFNVTSMEGWTAPCHWLGQRSRCRCACAR